MARAKKILKNLGVEVEEVVAVPETITIDVIAVGGGESIEAPKGITIAELKQLLNSPNCTFADKRTAKQMNDTDVLNEDTELYRVVIKPNA